MAIDAVFQTIQNPDYIGPGCMWERCGGFADYFRDRGAVVWGVSSFINTVTLGLTTSTGATTFLGEKAVISQLTGEAVPIIDGSLKLAGTFGLANSAQGIIEDGILGNLIDLEKVKNDFYIGSTYGLLSGGLRVLSNRDILKTQNITLEEIKRQTLITNLTGANFPKLTIPTNTEFSIFANVFSDISEFAIQVIGRLPNPR